MESCWSGVCVEALPAVCVPELAIAGVVALNTSNSEKKIAFASCDITLITDRINSRIVIVSEDITFDNLGGQQRR
jgi:hypothetical protein